jgi:hypothetical protein
VPEPKELATRESERTEVSAGRSVKERPIETLSRLLGESGMKVSFSINCRSGLVGKDMCLCWRCNGVSEAEEDANANLLARAADRAFKNGYAMGELAGRMIERIPTERPQTPEGHPADVSPAAGERMKGDRE